VWQVRFPARASVQFDYVLKEIQGMARIQPEISEGEALGNIEQLTGRVEQALKHRDRIDGAAKVPNAQCKPATASVFA
jgi:hypothetical protein